MEWKRLAKEFYDNDWPFSSAFAWEKAVEENPTAFNLFQLADSLRMCGNFIKSEEVFGRIEFDEIPMEHRFKYHNTKGRLFEDQGRMEEAISEYAKSLEVGTPFTNSYVFLGTLLAQKSEFSAAIDVLNQALDKEGDIDEVYFNLGTTYARLGDFEKAIDALRKCLELDPNFPNAQEFINDFKNLENIQGFQGESI
ncbi:MAG: tetratricopeptide repeat protein [Saprospiraceae bacterium]|nr:tetratricopeptide repeat protein [Saprospiraceae bacterium]